MPNSRNSPLPPSVETPSRFDPARLCLSQAYDQLASVKKVINTVPVRRPDPMAFVRVHPDSAWSLVGALLLERVEGQESFLVDPALHDEVAAVAKVKILYTAITRQGVLFLWPVGMTGPDGRSNAWHDSAQRAADMARKQWVRVHPNQGLGGYEVVVPSSELPEPEWPDLSLEQILELAFRDRFIDSVDHPVLRKLRGEV